VMGNQSFREHEYTALMRRLVELGRTSALCWTGGAVAAAVLLAGAISARNAGLLIPVEFCAAFGFYALLEARREARLLETYLSENYERERDGIGWFTHLSLRQAQAGVMNRYDWLPLALADALVLMAVAFSWLFSEGHARGELMASLATMAGIAFVGHSLVEFVRLERIPSSTAPAPWGQGPREVTPARRASSDRP